MKALAEIAITYKLAADYGNALKYFQQASLKDSNNKLFKIEQANCKFALEAFHFAKNDYLFLLAEDSLNTFMLKRLAFCYSKLNQNDSAINTYYKALRLYPNDASIIINLSNLLASSRKFKDGITVTENYLKIDSNDLPINRYNAYFYLLDKQYDKSIQLFSRCLNHHDTIKFVYKNLGISYFKKESYDTAKTFLEIAFAKDTADAHTAQFIGIACYRSYYKELGVKYLEKAIDLNLPSPETLNTLYSNLAEACRGYSNCPCEKTLNAYKKAWEYNPKDTIALMNIGLDYDYCMHDKQNAIAYYTLFLKTRPDQKKPKKTEEKTLTISYYDVIEKRLKEISKND